MTFDLRDSAPRACFGLACAVGMLGAFVGLNVSGFWLDELFTTWVAALGGGFHQVAARVLSDVHPPVYYGLIALWARLFGDSEPALRSFSALCGCGAVLVFILATGRTFSLNARLFAAALATGSGFWFYQAQNARDYALCLLIGTGILSLALRLLETRSQPRVSKPALGALLGLMVLGAFTHFYLMYEALAVLIVLALFLPRLRPWLATAFVALLGVSQAYVHFVIGPNSHYSLTSNWIQSSWSWDVAQLADAGHESVNSLALLAITICGLAALHARTRKSASRNALLAIDPVFVLCVGVPIIVLGGGILSSMLISPNFTARNWMVASPFLWGLFAWLYTVGPQRCGLGLRLAAGSALSLIALAMMSVVAGRLEPHNESFRESAALIRTFPACRDAQIPVMAVGQAAWSRPGFYGDVETNAYGHYLGSFASPRVIAAEAATSGDLPADLRAELQRRLDGTGCPVLAWASQGYDADHPDALSQRLLALADRPGDMSGLVAKPFQTYTYGLIRQPKPSGTVVLLANRESH